MPQLGESVTEGTLGRWLKEPGQMVEKYEPLVEVTTDKVNAEVPSPVHGILKSVIAKEGDTLAVGQPICEIEAQGEEPAETAHGAPPEAALPATAAPDPAPAPTPAPAPSMAPQTAAPAEAAVRTSPLVRKLAKEAGINLALVPGTGPQGRVTREDLEAYRQGAKGPVSTPTPTPMAAATPAASAPRPAPMPAAPGPAPKMGDHDTPIELTPMRRAIAEHMVRTKQTSPHATAWFEVDLSGVAALRSRLKADFEAREGVPLTFLPFVIQAAIEGILHYPILNSTFDGENSRIILRRQINVGIAVAVPDGLIVPVVKGADGLSLTGLTRKLDDVITRARQGRLTLDDIQGGTFTVNNPGSYGSMLSTPLINQPQAAILSMEKIVKRPVVVNDAIAIRSMMNLSMSFDHRVLDGAVANQYLSKVKEVLESMGPDSQIS